jgi:hypothetical protein
MPQELLSTDPKAGLLSTDANAGVVAAAPRGDRRDANAVGVDHDWIVQHIANWASKLPPRWQQPAAFIATLPADMLGSLVEMLSAPESIATLGAGGIPKPAAAVERPPGVPMTARVGAVARPVAKATSAVLDNDIAGAISPRAAHVGKIATRVSDALEKRAATAAGPAAPPETAAVGGTPAPPGPPPPAAPASAMSPQRVLNELAIQARRQGVKLSEQDYQAATQAVAQGVSPTDVVSALKQLQQPPDARAYMALRQAGKSNAEAMAELQGERDLAKRFGLPSTEEVEAAVKERNAKGYWKKKPKGDE